METMRIPEWTLGERLAKARREAGFTQEEMAEELDVSHSSIAKWEINKGQPRNMLKRLRQWSDLTGVSFTWLIEGEPPSRMRGSSTPRNRTGPGRGRLGGKTPGGLESPAYVEDERRVA